MSIRDDLARLAPPEKPDARLKRAGDPPPKRTQTGLQPVRAARVAADLVTAQSTDGLLTFVVQIVRV